MILLYFLLLHILVIKVNGDPDSLAIQVEALTRNRKVFEGWFTRGLTTARFSCLDTCVEDGGRSGQNLTAKARRPIYQFEKKFVLKQKKCLSNMTKIYNMTSYCSKRRDMDINVDILDSNTYIYFELNRFVSWANAGKLCRERGMELGVLGDTAKFQSIVTFLTYNYRYKYIVDKASFWTGGNNFGSSSMTTFYWSATGAEEALAAFTSNSKKTKKGNCLYLTGILGDGTAKVIEGGCKLKKQFFCEVPSRCFAETCVPKIMTTTVTEALDPKATTAMQNDFVAGLSVDINKILGMGVYKKKKKT